MALRSADASAPYLSLHQPCRQKLLLCPALLLQRLVKLYLACRRNRCTGPARTWDSASTCLPPCSQHLPDPAGPPRFVFTALARFSHIPVDGFPWPHPPFPISRIARVQHAFFNPTPGYPSMERASLPPLLLLLTPVGSWPPAGSPRPCPFLGVIQPRPQPHGGAETRPGVEEDAS